MTNIDIMNAVRVAVCAQLKSPASAQFAEDKWTITGNDQAGYTVSGYVDSQNSYGAMIRNDFSAVVKPENGVPRVLFANVGTQTNAQNSKSFCALYLIISIVTGIGGLILYFLISSFVDLAMF